MSRTPILLLFVLIQFNLYSADVESLLVLTGSDFTRELGRLSDDKALVSRLREGKGSPRSLRVEFLKKLVISRVDHGDVFESFQDFLDLNREGSPLRGNLSFVTNGFSLDENFLIDHRARWLRSAPQKNEWQLDELSTPGIEARRSNSYWPALAFGLSAEPARVRWTMHTAYFDYCKAFNFGRLQLEVFLWHCERANYQIDAALWYRTALRESWKLAAPEGRRELMDRYIGMWEIGGNLLQPNDSITIDFILDNAEEFGGAELGERLRKISQAPVWADYKEKIERVARKLSTPDR